MAKIISFPGSVNEAKDYLDKKISNGDIEGVIILVENKTKTFEFFHTDFRYLDKIGMLETTKQDIYMKTNVLL